VAVPWLVQIENSIIQGMTRAVAFAAVEIAGWIGVGAYQIGNIIELHNGFVGVDEACSGVKTLQASIMVALVLGELFQLRAARRVGLLVAGAAWVFLCNVLRATTLVIIAAKQGTGALTSWHDPVGIAVLIGGMAGLGRSRLADARKGTAAARRTKRAAEYLPGPRSPRRMGAARARDRLAHRHLRCHRSLVPQPRTRAGRRAGVGAALADGRADFPPDADRGDDPRDPALR
jgi:exosortase/archaeosortase family protein